MAQLNGQQLAISNITTPQQLQAFPGAIALVIQASPDNTEDVLVSLGAPVGGVALEPGASYSIQIPGVTIDPQLFWVAAADGATPVDVVLHVYTCAAVG